MIFKQYNRTDQEQEQVHSALIHIQLQYNFGDQYQPPEEILKNKYYQDYEFLDDLTIRINKHIKYANNKLHDVGKSIIGLDTGQPWCIYWPLNVLASHNVQVDNQRIIQFLKYCQSEGFGGGHYQYAHLAPTYASLLCMKINHKQKALLILATEESLSAIDLKGLEKFFWSVRLPNGSFIMHQNGECDLRGAYIAVIFVKLFNLDEKIIEGTAEFIASCQTYEGGLGSNPFSEAHGGYAFCGFAALKCLQKQHLINIDKLREWLVNRQMEQEGGFNGRTNKVVDSCYSFWCGAIFNLLDDKVDLKDTGALQKYISMCQNPDGGLFDKPGKRADAYHTSYSLSGYYLSKNEIFDPIYNIPKASLEFARAYFNNNQKQ